MTQLTAKPAEFRLSQTEDGRGRVEVLFDAHTSWLSIGRMESLFQRN